MTQKRLLIIDDEPQFGVVIREIAETCGFEVETTLSAETFKASYVAFRPDAIILGLAVPEIDGIQLLRWLADTGCVASIAITSGLGSKVIESAKALGHARGLRMAETIPKPIRASDLPATLNSLL